MERIDKFKGLSVKKADATADIDLINQYAVKELAPEDVTATRNDSPKRRLISLPSCLLARPASVIIGGARNGRLRGSITPKSLRRAGKMHWECR